MPFSLLYHDDNDSILLVWMLVNCVNCQWKKNSVNWNWSIESFIQFHFIHLWVLFSTEFFLWCYFFNCKMCRQAYKKRARKKIVNKKYNSRNFKSMRWSEKKTAMSCACLYVYLMLSLGQKSCKTTKAFCKNVTIYS